MTSIVDFDRHVGVGQFSDLFPLMSQGWRKHFEREEFIASVDLTSNHIRVSDDFRQAPVESSDSTQSGLLLPYQALTINGWADKVAAQAFLEALNRFGLEHWASGDGRLALAVSPYNVEWSAAQVREAPAEVAAVALPLIPEMLGSSRWNPLYDACVDAGLPVLVHYSGVEGHYLGAPPISGGTHRSAFARLALMPHVAESNIASLAFEGTFVRYPGLQFLFSGFGFTWLPTLLWRIDREWRTFRHDVPWITEPPSERMLENMWFTTWPAGETANNEHWEATFTERLRSRIVFGSHAPHDGDDAAGLADAFGAEWLTRLARNGTEFLAARSKARN